MEPYSKIHSLGQLINVLELPVAVPSIYYFYSLDLIHRVVIHDLLKSGCTLPPSLVSKLFSLYCRRAKVKNAIELFLDHCKYLKALPEEKVPKRIITFVIRKFIYCFVLAKCRAILN